MNRSLFFIFLFLVMLDIKAMALVPVTSSSSPLSQQSETIMKALWDSIYAGKIPFPSMTLKKEEEKDKSKDTPKELGKGERYVSEALAKNRAAIKEQQALKKQEQEGLSKSKDESLSVQDQYKAWASEAKSTYDGWRKERDAFLSRIDEYKKALVEIPPAPKKVPLSERIQKVYPQFIEAPYYIVPSALDVAIKDQGRRSTCSAFAAIRAVEILLQQHGRKDPLSEEYFYWASRPDCQKAPCSSKGAWVLSGLSHGQASSSPDIPTSRFCPYDANPMPSNETHTPLMPTCLSGGKAKVTKYREINTLNDLMDSLKKGKPVIAGVRLSESFYRNEGLVLDSEPGKQVDDHALGHALLFVGYIELPKTLLYQGGQVCFIAANSWGVGFGKGGYSCLSEKWLNHYRGNNPFVVIEELEVL